MFKNFNKGLDTFYLNEEQIEDSRYPIITWNKSFIEEDRGLSKSTFPCCSWWYFPSIHFVKLYVNLSGAARVLNITINYKKPHYDNRWQAGPGTVTFKIWEFQIVFQERKSCIMKTCIVFETKSLYCSLFEHVQPSGIDRQMMDNTEISTSQFYIQYFSSL